MSTGPLTTVHLYGVSSLRAPLAAARMALDRRHLRRCDGLRFWKLLGTGTGDTFTLRDADHRRWGLFAVWESRAALDAFEAASPAAAAWNRLAEERWRVDLELLRARGRWAGRDPFADVAAASGDGGPVAAVTRARIRRGRARSFWRAVPPVSADLHRSPGVLLSLGIGEAPFGLQGTFSVWESAAALGEFAYRGAVHRDAIARTASESWYAEELFARFRVAASHGTVDGRDPLAAAG